MEILLNKLIDISNTEKANFIRMAPLFVENKETNKIFENLEKIVDSVQNLQKDNENQDHQLESWTPLMESIEDFSQKKLILQDRLFQFFQLLCNLNLYN